MEYLSNIYRMDSKEKIPKVYLSFIKFTYSYLLMVILLMPCCCGIPIDEEIAELRKRIDEQSTAVKQYNSFHMLKELKLIEIKEDVNELSKRISYLEQIQPSLQILQNKLESLNKSTNKDISKLVETIKTNQLQPKCKKGEPTELDRNYEETKNNFQELQRLLERTDLAVDFVNKESNQNNQYTLVNKLEINDNQLQPLFKQLDEIKHNQQILIDELKKKVSELKPEFVQVDVQLNLIKHQQNEINELQQKLYKINIELSDVKKPLCKDKEQAGQEYANADQTTTIKGYVNLDQRKDNQYDLIELQQKVNIMQPQLISVIQQLNQSRQQHQYEINELHERISNTIQPDIISVKEQLIQNKQQQEHDKHELQYKIDNIIHIELINVKEQLNQSKEQNQNYKNELQNKIDVMEPDIVAMKEQFVKQSLNVQDSLKELQAKAEDLDVHNIKNNDKLLNCSKFMLNLLNKHGTWTGNKWENFLNKRLLNSSKVFQEDFVSLILDVYGNVNSEDSRKNNFGLNYIASLLTCQFLVTALPALPAEEYQNIQTKLICERSEGQFVCVNGRRIQIIDAFYGRHSSSICDTKYASNTNCKRSITHLVSKDCNHRTVCHLRANNDVYGDPCWGVAKYINVYYICYK